MHTVRLPRAQAIGGGHRLGIVHRRRGDQGHTAAQTQSARPTTAAATGSTTGEPTAQITTNAGTVLSSVGHGENVLEINGKEYSIGF